MATTQNRTSAWPCTRMPAQEPPGRRDTESPNRPVRGKASGAPARVPECTTQQESCQLLHTHVTTSPRRCGATRDADARVLPPSPSGTAGKACICPPHFSQFERGFSWCMRVGGAVSVAEESSSQKTTGSMPIRSRSCSVAACSPRPPMQKKPQSLALGRCLPCYRAKARETPTRRVGVSLVSYPLAAVPISSVHRRHARSLNFVPRPTRFSALSANRPRETADA
jgi:hypothetical protein